MENTFQPPKLRKYYSSTTLLIRDSDYDEEPLTSSDSDIGDENGNGIGLAIEDRGKIPNNKSSSNLTVIHENVDEHQPLLLKVHASPKHASSDKHPTKKIGKHSRRDSNSGRREIESINLADEIKGALIFHIPSNCICRRDYTVRIYLHYWIWQIPVLITNIILFCIWNTTHNNPNPTISLTELGFLAVGPVFLSSLVRDKIFLWGIYWTVKKTPHLGCTKYGRYHISRLADCIGGLHSSLGVTALVWNVIYAIGAFIREDYSINMRSGTAFCLPFLLIIICLSALPCLRHHYHNSFEIIHRYLNWLALCLLITHVT
eukprot:87022_1